MGLPEASGVLLDGGREAVTLTALGSTPSELLAAEPLRLELGVPIAWPVQR
jgi:hypothetical protein